MASNDPEIKALQVIEEYVFVLRLEAQDRVARWLSARVGAEKEWHAEELRQRNIELALREDAALEDSDG